MLILQDIRTWRFWRHFLANSFGCLGVLSTILQTLSVIKPEIKVYQGTGVLISIALISLIVGIALSWPRPISEEYSSPNTKISIVKGNLLSESSHLVIGTNDTFDTETPIIISNDSLQGQALAVLFGGDINELNDKLSLALSSRVPCGNIVKAGKQVKYGIGAVATVKHAARLLFFVAYTEMDSQNRAQSTPDKVWQSLISLWDEISSKGNGKTVSIPVIGGGLARLSSVLPAQDAIRFTILSFMFASRNSRICDELRIVVRPTDYKKLDRLELQSFLSSLKSS